MHLPRLSYIWLNPRPRDRRGMFFLESVEFLTSRIRSSQGWRLHKDILVALWLICPLPKKRFLLSKPRSVATATPFFLAPAQLNLHLKAPAWTSTPSFTWLSTA